MCVVSAIGAYWRDSLPQQPYYPAIQPLITVPAMPVSSYISPPITRAEFDQLKHDVEELKKLLMAAKQFDEATGQPHCETDDKVALIRRLANLVGVSVEDIFGK